jgi:hypothetical protein
MYVDPLLQNQQIYFQGDILKDFPFYVLDRTVSVDKKETGVYEPSGVLNDSNIGLKVIEKKLETIILLSQSCDLQRREYVLICPVFKLEDLVSEQILNKETVGLIKKRKLYYLFYLPGTESFPESIADFQHIYHIPRSELEGLMDKRILSLSDNGRHHLGWALANYFGRPAE